MIIAVLVALLFNQLPEYLLGTYSDYLALAVVALLGALVFIVMKHK